MAGVHVVLGTGVVGLALIEELSGMGLQTRAVNRSGNAEVPEGVEVFRGDVSDAGVATDAAAGAAAVYQCLNPPYDKWPELFPPLQRAAVDAARLAGARYVSFENTYMYGDTQGKPITEETPHRPHTRKGKVREAMADELRRLNDAGDVAVATARASDYFGPRATVQSQLGQLVVGAALAGKSARVVGDPDHPHSYTYVFDAARTLVALGTRDDVLGVWHVPNAPVQSTREIIAMVSEEIGSDVKVSPAPKIVLRAMGLFNTNVRELYEMLYEFDQPFIVDGTKAETRLGIVPTPLDEAIRDTVAWFRSQTL